MILLLVLLGSLLFNPTCCQNSTTGSATAPTSTQSSTTATSTNTTKRPISTPSTPSTASTAASTKPPDLDCIQIAGNLNPNEIIRRLTNPCRYEKFSRPETSAKRPLIVSAHIYVYFLGPIEAQSLQFSAHILVRLRWRDPRLAYEKLSLGSRPRQIIVEGGMRELLWKPHVYLVNEQASFVMGADQKDMLVTVLPDGHVSSITRMKVTLFCLMNLQKFPFDDQTCPMILESWTYNSTQVRLIWEKAEAPVSVNPDLHLTEYRLVRTGSTDPPPKSTRLDEAAAIALETGQGDLFGKMGGNYSSLTVSFHLEREIGYYILDYYVPSILLVVVSWVTFWLDPNAVPGRTTLGTSTMLTFITLTRNTGNNLPKVSYVKATEIWFLVCTGFIFGSLVEFAFVNTIWRRRKNVELKKVNSKYILKSTLTPQLARRQIGKSNSSDQSKSSGDIDRCQSWPSIGDDQKISTNTNTTNHRPRKFYLGNTPSTNTLRVGSATDPTGDDSTNSSNESLSTGDVIIQVPTGSTQQQQKGNKKLSPSTWTTMTPQDIAKWIDRRSRIFFPAAFLIFNIFYWTFVYIF